MHLEERFLDGKEIKGLELKEKQREKVQKHLFMDTGFEYFLLFIKVYNILKIRK